MNSIKAVKLGLAVSALVLMAACAAPVETTLPDGTVAYRIDCDGTAGGLNYCFERAGKSCGAAGYMVVGQDGRMILTSGVVESDIEAAVRAYETDKNSILIKCGS